MVLLRRVKHGSKYVPPCIYICIFRSIHVYIAIIYQKTLLRSLCIAYCCLQHSNSIAKMQMYFNLQYFPCLMKHQIRKLNVAIVTAAKAY